MTNYSRSVLLSNGLHHSKNLPEKFGFSPKIVPANIVQKLPPQRCSKPLFIAFFSLSHKRPTFAFTGESGYTLAFRRKIAHNGTHAETGAFRTGVVSLPSDRSARFGNPAWPGGRAANFAAFGSWSETLPKNAESLRDSDALMRVAVPRRRGPAGLRDPIAVSLTALMGFTVLSGHDNSMQRKMLAGFTRWSAPCVLPLAAVPLLCPQHPSAADKTGRWKTGSAGSCRADFRFACARPA